MEICIDTLESAENAFNGGATRLEVCSALSEGGLTPSPNFVKSLKNLYPTIPLYVMIRIRSGNFIYTQSEIDVMLLDLDILKLHGADGFVFGALTPFEEVQVEQCRQIIRTASPYPVTFHRAFDEVLNPYESLNTISTLGFERILTSGKEDTAEKGVQLIRELVEYSRNKIIVMPGAGITDKNILKIKRETLATEFHASAMKKFSDDMRRMVTDQKMVLQMVNIIKQM